jgi:hypothetical protein
MSSKASRRGRFFGRRRAKPIEMLPIENEPRAWDPRMSAEDWLRFHEIADSDDDMQPLENSR